MCQWAEEDVTAKSDKINDILRKHEKEAQVCACACVLAGLCTFCVLHVVCRHLSRNTLIPFLRAERVEAMAGHQKAILDQAASGPGHI